MKTGGSERVVFTQNPMSLRSMAQRGFQNGPRSSLLDGYTSRLKKVAEGKTDTASLYDMKFIIAAEGYISIDEDAAGEWGPRT